MQPQQQSPDQPGQVDPNNAVVDNKESFFDIIKKDIKEPIIIGIIAFILSLSQVDNMLVSTGLSFIIGENGSLSMMGVAFKCLSIGIIYYMIKLFLKS